MLEKTLEPFSHCTANFRFETFFERKVCVNCRCYSNIFSQVGGKRFTTFASKRECLEGNKGGRKDLDRRFFLFGYNFKKCTFKPLMSSQFLGREMKWPLLCTDGRLLLSKNLGWLINMVIISTRMQLNGTLKPIPFFTWFLNDIIFRYLGWGTWMISEWLVIFGKYILFKINFVTDEFYNKN